MEALFPPPLLEPQTVTPARGRSAARVAALALGRHAAHNAACTIRCATACVFVPWLAPAVFLDCVGRHFVDAANGLQSVDDALAADE